MSVSGLQRHRRLQIGWQTSFGSNTSATKVLPYRAKPKINPNLTEPDVDVGSLDPILPLVPGAAEYSTEWDGPNVLAFNDLPDLWTGIIKGGVAPTGAVAKQHIFQAASLTQDAFSYFTQQWGDDVTSDWAQFGSSILNELEMGFDEDLGVWSITATALSSRSLFSGPTGGLAVDSSPTWVFGTDTEVFVDSVAASIGTTKWTDTVHTANIHITPNNDPKRFANGSNSRFQIANFGRGQREIEVTLGVAKTAATIAEKQTIDDGPPAQRYIELRTTSPVIITGSTPYSQSIRLPVRLMDYEDTEFGDNNTGYNLIYRARYDTTLLYAIRVVTVTTNGTSYP